MPPNHRRSLSGVGFSVAGLLPSAQVSSAVVMDGLGWILSEVSAAHVVVAPAQSRSSASSTVLSHGDVNDNSKSRGNSSSSHGGSLPKEHDYIGLEVSSSPRTSHTERETVDGKARASKFDLKLEETELRLGLGLPDLSASAGSKAGGYAAFSPRKGFDSSPNRASTSNHRSAERKLSGAAEKAAYGGDVHSLGNRGLDHDSLEKTGSSCEANVVTISDDIADDVIVPDHLPSSLRSLQYRRNEEGILVSRGLDFSTLQPPLSGNDCDASSAAHLNGYATSRFALATAKNGVKRAYDEAMVEKRFNYGEIRSCSSYEGATRANAVGGTALILGGPALPAGMTSPEAELKRFSQQSMLAQAPYVYSWASAHTPSFGTVGQFQPLQSKGVGGAGTPSDPAVDPPAPLWEARSTVPEVGLAVERRPSPSMEKQPPSSSGVSSPKGQVVGWPPIRSFRKNTLASPPKPSEDGEGFAETPDAASGSSASPAGFRYVKVNMDGVPIGRKVDLNAYNCYEALILSLEEMFQRPHTGLGGIRIVSGNDNVPLESTRLRSMNGTDFILIYEDREGDWMLVGDVPWGMFITAVRRLWITKAADAIGVVPRSSMNAVSHGIARSSTRT